MVHSLCGCWLRVLRPKAEHAVMSISQTETSVLVGCACRRQGQRRVSRLGLFSGISETEDRFEPFSFQFAKFVIPEPRDNWGICSRPRLPAGLQFGTPLRCILISRQSTTATFLIIIDWQRDNQHFEARILIWYVHMLMFGFNKIWILLFRKQAM
jgi:hypothetical protein